MMKKNDTIRCEIIDINKDGIGIGKVDGVVIFVKKTIIGDEVEAKIIKVKKNYLVGRLIRILRESPFRITPDCDIFYECGGCQMMNVNYDAQLRIKKNIVTQTLSRIAGIDKEIYDVVPSDKIHFYRNKVSLPVKEQGGKVVIGYYKSRSHEVVEPNQCLVEYEKNREVISLIKDFITEHHIRAYDENTGRGTIRHVVMRLASGPSIAVTLVINGERLKAVDKLVSKLKDLEYVKSLSLNINKEKGNKILGDKTVPVYGDKYLVDDFDNVKYRISPNSFYQINKPQAIKLYKQVRAYLDGQKDKTLLDLYSGIGTISIFVADKVKKVIGVEVVEQAVVDARSNALLNKVNSATFICQKAEEEINKLVGEEKIDIIVVDPPRKGLHENVIRKIIEIHPEKLIYVSCDVATLARDLKILKKHYNVEEVTPYDFFPLTMHCEVIAVLSRK